MHDLPFGEALLVAVWIEACLFGLAVLTYATCMSILWQRRREQGGRWSFMAFATLMFAVEVAHVAAGCRFVVEGYIRDPAGPASYYANWFHPMAKLNISMWLINGILADGLLVWRLWVVYQRSFAVVVFPAILYLATIGLGIVACFKEWELNANPTGFFKTGQVLKALLTLSIALNVTLTGAIALRIARVSSAAAGGITTTDNGRLWHSSSKRYGALIATLIESAAVYTFANAFSLGFYWAQLNIGVITEFIAAPVAVIAPNLIIVRVGLGKAFGQKELTTVNRTTATVVFSREQEVFRDGELQFTDHSYLHDPDHDVELGRLSAKHRASL